MLVRFLLYIVFVLFEFFFLGLAPLDRRKWLVCELSRARHFQSRDVGQCCGRDVCVCVYVCDNVLWSV